MERIVEDIPFKSGFTTKGKKKILAKLSDLSKIRNQLSCRVAPEPSSPHTFPYA